MKKPIIGITMGDPSGIGPEIILKSYLDPEINQLSQVVIGDYGVMKKAADSLKLIDFKLRRITEMKAYQYDPGILCILDLELVNLDELLPGVVQEMSGNAAFQCVKKATELALEGEIDAIATAPLNKEAMHKAGHLFPGHTEILATLSNTKDYAMLLYDEKLKVIHVSTHVSLLKAIQSLSIERVATVIQIAHDTLRRVGYERPRIAVAGINPHAGESGLFGDEEIKFISPAIQLKREEGIDVVGPEPPDTVFFNGVNGQFDVVVAMYHDQGHIPLKLVGFHSGVNVSAGLPIIRTSVDHGTAFGRAWKGTANESSMKQAIILAAKLASDK